MRRRFRTGDADIYPHRHDKKNNEGKILRMPVSGVIGRINNKQWNGKTFYSLALKGQEGWYNTGLKRPPSEGTSVKFEFKTNPKGYKDVDGIIEVLTDGEAASAGTVPQVAGQVAKSGNGGQSAYWDRKEARDLTNDSAREVGASRNTAISLIDLALKHELIPVPAAKAKKEEFLWALLDKYTAKLMGKEPDSSGEQEDPTKTDAPTDKLDPDDTWN